MSSSSEVIANLRKKYPEHFKSKKDAKWFLETILQEIVTDAIETGYTKLPGFGRIDVFIRPEREVKSAYSPTGVKKVEARPSIKFTPGSKVKTRLVDELSDKLDDPKYDIELHKQKRAENSVVQGRVLKWRENKGPSPENTINFSGHHVYKHKPTS
jgi:nucleoid DNA-binding protein